MSTSAPLSPDALWSITNDIENCVIKSATLRDGKLILDLARTTTTLGEDLYECAECGNPVGSETVVEIDEAISYRCTLILDSFTHLR